MLTRIARQDGGFWLMCHLFMLLACSLICLCVEPQLACCSISLSERLEKELHKIFPPPMSDGIKVIPPTYGVDSAWFGAKIVSNVSIQHLLIIDIIANEISTYDNSYIFLTSLIFYFKYVLTGNAILDCLSFDEQCSIRMILSVLYITNQIHSELILMIT